MTYISRNELGHYSFWQWLVRRQPSIWTNVDLLLIGSLEINSQNFEPKPKACTQEHIKKSLCKSLGVIFRRQYSCWFHICQISYDNFSNHKLPLNPDRACLWVPLYADDSSSYISSGNPMLCTYHGIEISWHSLVNKELGYRGDVSRTIQIEPWALVVIYLHVTLHTYTRPLNNIKQIESWHTNALMNWVIIRKSNATSSVIYQLLNKCWRLYNCPHPHPPRKKIRP